LEKAKESHLVEMLIEREDVLDAKAVHHHFSRTIRE